MPIWVGVVLLGAAIVFGEQALTRFGIWAAMKADLGTPCGQVMCSCPSTQLARAVAVTPCGGTDVQGSVCIACGRDTEPRQPMRPAPSMDSDHPGLLMMAAVSPLVLVIRRPKTRATPPMLAGRTDADRRSSIRSRSLGVDPQPPNQA
ncbi:MAG: hypothetical protein HRU13_11025 [Phycisphaerales bacterium]|nr:hypothetical protein [Phycisphaerales bacterium]